MHFYPIKQRIFQKSSESGEFDRFSQMVLRWDIRATVQFFGQESVTKETTNPNWPLSLVYASLVVEQLSR